MTETSKPSMNSRAVMPQGALGLAIAIVGGLLPIIFQSDSYVVLLLCTTGISIIVISGLDILFGYTGQISLGHAGFYCIGAYASAILSRDLGLPVFATILLGGMLATILAIVLALPAVKLVHHFLALVTISFGQLVYLFVSQARGLTEGFSGMNFIPRPRFGSFEFESNVAYFYIVYAILLLLLVLKQTLVRSRTGRAFVAIREDAHAANGMGIHVTKYKTMAFAISAFYTGVAGALYAHLIGFISPESFTLNQSTLFLTMLLFGGMGNFWGPIIGACALTILSEYLQKFGSYQMLVYGVFLLAIIVYIPSGISRGIDVKSYFRKFAGKGKKSC
jgi:branched-chain amino acid transport system permease protein